MKGLDGLNGKQLFSMKTDDFEKAFGKDEGHRLKSQIIVMKNVAGVSCSNNTINTILFNSHSLNTK